MNIFIKYLILSICFIFSILVAIIFPIDVKKKIRTKKEFDGIMWGIANGLVGLGLLWVIIAHASINKEIDKIKDKKYKKYALEQMREFVKNYALFIVLWLVIALFVLR